MTSRRTDFFISHAGRDSAWAEWLAWQLQELGYTVELDVWDWAPGEDFVARMAAALESADQLLAVCTEAYFASTFGGAELRAAFAAGPAAVGRIVPVLIEPVALPPLYAPLIHLDLTGLDEGAAAARLRSGWPGSAQPAPRLSTGSGAQRSARIRLPPASGVAGAAAESLVHRRRDGVLVELRRRLRAAEPALVVQALYGLGGVGKTHLAIEYAHRCAVAGDAPAVPQPCPRRVRSSAPLRPTSACLPGPCHRC